MSCPTEWLSSRCRPATLCQSAIWLANCASKSRWIQLDKYRMKNLKHVGSVLKKTVAALCLFGAVTPFGQAQAQSQGAADTSGSSSVPVEQPISSGGLPTIGNAGGDGRVQQALQANQRATSRQQQDAVSKELRNVSGDRDVFANYVRTVTGGSLDLFGKSLFSEVPTTFAPFSSAQVNGDYVIGTGDEIQIRGWGMVNVDVTATVDRNGAVYIPRVGSVKVSGVKYRDLQGHLKQAIGKNFSNFDLTASISQTRAVQIYVVGHAVRPGTYTLNAMSTLLNALFTSGGPDASGTMRNIQLKRNGSTVTSFDLYDMLVRGDKSQDATLQDGDVIYIPEVGSLVALSGNVKTPAIFEIKGNSSLAEVIGWAGGIDSAADSKKIVIEKTVNNSYQTIAELVGEKGTIAARLSNISLRPGDVIRVFAPDAVPLPAQQQIEYVQVSGEVKQGGVYQLRKGETLRELMLRIGGTTDVGYVFATQLKRESVRRVQQQKLDEAATRFERDLDASARADGTTDRDAMAIKAAEVERQRRVAVALRNVKAEGRIVLEMEDGKAQLKNLPDLELQNGDSIFVPRMPGTVDVLGAVFQSNSFIYKSQRTVKDYVQLAGGTTETGDTSQMYLIRADGTARSGGRFFSGLGGETVNPGDTIVVPEKIERTSWRQSLKEWTAIFYQFGLGAAGLKVLKD